MIEKIAILELKIDTETKKVFSDIHFDISSPRIDKALILNIKKELEVSVSAFELWEKTFI